MVQTREREAPRTEITPEVLPQPRISVPLTEVAEQLFIPLVIRPWWGSRRTRASRYHRKCGKALFGSERCSTCSERVEEKDVELRWLFRREWLCSANGSENQITWPEVQNGVVVVWEGPCGKTHYGRYHKHHQELEVLDVGDTAFLLKVTVLKRSGHFIIGRDGGHPFARMVSSHQTTLQDAFDWLVPTKVREALVLGLDVKRQGDWWFIPTKRAPQRSSNKRHVFSSAPALRSGTLYRGAPLCWNVQTRHTGGLVIYQSVAGLNYLVPVVKGQVKAPDHPTLTLESWHIAVRNRSTPAGDGQGRLDD